jgi:hypothetical protein
MGGRSLGLAGRFVRSPSEESKRLSCHTQHNPTRKSCGRCCPPGGPWPEIRRGGRVDPSRASYLLCPRGQGGFRFGATGHHTVPRPAREGGRDVPRSDRSPPGAVAVSVPTSTTSASRTRSGGEGGGTQTGHDGTARLHGYEPRAWRPCACRVPVTWMDCGWCTERV